jgi:hypothetical protein
MSTLDEITKEKERIGEVLARVDAQRERLTSQLSELEATERLLARYSKGTEARKTASARTRTTATKGAPAPGRARRITAARPAGGKRGSSSLSNQVLALATGKTQQEIAAAKSRVRGVMTNARVFQKGLIRLAAIPLVSRPDEAQAM